MSESSNPAERGANEVHRRVGDLWEQAARGWMRWEPELVGSLAPVTHALLRGLRLEPGMRVLDFGSGIGEPALPAAAAVGPTGSVRGVDLSPTMIDVCRERAKMYGLSNASFEVGAVEELNEARGTFDAVVGRFSIIFFPDVLSGLRRLHEFLRPGGRIAVSTWTPPEVNPGFALPSRELRKVVDLPPSQPDEPGPFRLAGDGELAAALYDAGFADVVVEDVPLYMFARDATRYWEMLQEISASFREQYEALPDEKRSELKRLIRAAVLEYQMGDVIRLPMLARVGLGVKPI